MSNILIFDQSGGKEIMTTVFHGIDRHKRYFTIPVLNRKGEEVDFRTRCYGLKEFIGESRL